MVPVSVKSITGGELKDSTFVVEKTGCCAVSALKTTEERGVFFDTDVCSGTPVVYLCCKTEEEARRNHVHLNHFPELPCTAQKYAIQISETHVCTDGSLLEHYSTEEVSEVESVDTGSIPEEDTDAEGTGTEAGAGAGAGTEAAINFLNHSCDPTTWFEPSTFLLIAKRDVKAGTEVTFDYATVDGGSHLLLDMECVCGSVHCRGYIGPSSYLEVCHTHVSPYIAALLDTAMSHEKHSVST